MKDICDCAHVLISGVQEEMGGRGRAGEGQGRGRGGGRAGVEQSGGGVEERRR